MGGLTSILGSNAHSSIGQRIDEYRELMSNVPKSRHDTAMRELFLRSLPLLSDDDWKVVREETAKSCGYR